MKTLKFDHDQAQDILSGQKNSTWRFFDDKDISVNDLFRVIDKVRPDDSKSWKLMGNGKVTEIVEKNLGDIEPSEMSGFKTKDDMLANYRQYYGERVTLETPVKIIFFEFTPGTGDIPTGGMLLEQAKIYTDGGSRNNPGDSACAYVICNLDDTVVEKSGYYMGTATNNQAEYYGMIKGLERARDLGINKVFINSDSQLVVNQMGGVYKVKNQELAPLHQQLKELVDLFSQVTFTYVPRELNRIADSEVNRILDEHERAKKHKRH